MSVWPKKIFMRQVDECDPDELELTYGGDPAGFEYVRADIASDREKSLEAENEKLWAAINDVRDLIESSEGVVGLHGDGDIAPWQELLAGGDYQIWLYRISAPLTEGNKS